MPKKQEKFLKGCGLLWDVAKLLALVALGYLSACPPRSLKREGALAAAAAHPSATGLSNTLHAPLLLSHRRGDHSTASRLCGHDRATAR